ncbi:MAG: Slp family lipoprotein [Nitrospiraceae bacterium]|nr:Slp family lipoprotein [Nitrospiraceae bacterium]
MGWFGLLMVWVLVQTGCTSGPPVIPPEFDQQIDRSVSFSQLRSAADQYRGYTVLLGGEVLSAKRLHNGTELEILQLPVNDDDPPAERRSESQGRFLAMARDGVDPASLPRGTRVTVIGEVTGNVVQRLDESDYRYPTVDLKHLHVWEPADYQRRRSAGPRVGLFGGMGLGMGGGGGSFGGLSIGTGF